MLGRAGVTQLLAQLGEGITRRLWRNWALKNLCGRHAVAGIGATAFLQQQQLKLLVSGAGLLRTPVDLSWNSL